MFILEWNLLESGHLIALDRDDVIWTHCEQQVICIMATNKTKVTSIFMELRDVILQSAMYIFVCNVISSHWYWSNIYILTYIKEWVTLMRASNLRRWAVGSVTKMININHLGRSGSDFRRRYVLAWSPTNGLPTNHASIGKGYTEMLQPTTDDDPSITNWCFAQKTPCYKMSVNP